MNKAHKVGKGYSITALVLSLVGIFFLPIGIVGLIFGIISLSKKYDGKNLARAAVIITSIQILIIVIAIIFSFVSTMVRSSTLMLENKNSCLDYSIRINNYSCDAINDKITINLENNGSFNIFDFWAGGMNNSDSALQLHTDDGGFAGANLKNNPLLPGNSETITLSYKTLNSLKTLKFNIVLSDGFICENSNEESVTEEKCN